MSYNGWTNWETWNLALWVGNDEAAYRHVRHRAPYDESDAEHMGRELFPDGTPDMNGADDLLAVDWQEIADAWNEE